MAEIHPEEKREREEGKGKDDAQAAESRIKEAALTVAYKLFENSGLIRIHNLPARTTAQRNLSNNKVFIYQ